LNAAHTLEKTLQRAAGGDEAAWQRIVEAYGPRVFGLIRAQCGNAELAEEISQSTFCTIVARIGQYTELGRFESWLFRIAMNRLRDEMRRRKRHAHPVETEALVGLAGGTRSRPCGPPWTAYRRRIGESFTCGTSPG
jgi:DNA-directed RNA polymerase specialized sigma24 family protein